MNESNQSSESESLKERARKIVESGEDVRERIRKLLVDGVREGRLSREELADATEHIIEGAVGAADDASSPHLREVIDGLSEGYQAAAHATRLAVEEAASQGSGFAREQTQQVIDDLRTLDELLVETLQRTASAVIREADEAGRGLVEHARRAAQRVKDPVARAIRTLQEHPVDTASEAAAAGTRAAGQAAGTIFNVARGMIDGAMDVVREGRKSPTTDSPEGCPTPEEDRADSTDSA